MNSVKVLLSAIAIILLTSILSGCGTTKTVSENPTPVEKVQMAREITKEVSMNISSEIDGDMVTVKIVLDNPEKKSITSVQSWLSYNPKALRGVSINAENSPFTLSAPYENQFDDVLGLVMLGRGNDEPVEDKEINVAEVVFEKIGEGATMIDAYDYKQDLSGHSSVNMMYDGFPYNILIKPESPVLIISN